MRLDMKALTTTAGLAGPASLNADIISIDNNGFAWASDAYQMGRMDVKKDGDADVANDSKWVVNAEAGFFVASELRKNRILVPTDDGVVEAGPDFDFAGVMDSILNAEHTDHGIFRPDVFAKWKTLRTSHTQVRSPEMMLGFVTHNGFSYMVGVSTDGRFTGVGIGNRM